MITYALCNGEWLCEVFVESFRVGTDGYLPLVKFTVTDSAAYCIVEFSYY